MHSKPESKETSADEKKESPAKQKKEQEEGTEMHDSNGVVLPEQFQKDAHALISKAHTRHHTAHVRRLVDEKDDEHRKKESKNKIPNEYSTSEMP